MTPNALVAEIVKWQDRALVAEEKLRKLQSEKENNELGDVPDPPEHTGWTFKDNMIYHDNVMVAATFNTAKEGPYSLAERIATLLHGADTWVMQHEMQDAHHPQVGYDEAKVCGHRWYGSRADVEDAYAIHVCGLTPEHVTNVHRCICGANDAA